ncbi:DUF3488 and transglutaminase-like domain-containing protein [Actinomadura madurae]|uniref:transglutaminase family protein n=1 Tax=Actinomadura madurae TaxID=1993 RepID=UPI002026DD48|nr:transglutaminase domain-containing protein [Actinomadura madurae]URM98898.1 DUF3488 and transglutaminase-like domain-containing protein [Actinomadura madurae]
MKHSTSIVTLAITTGLAVAAGLAFVPLVEARALVVLPLAAVLPSLIVGLGPGRATLPVAAAGCFTFGPALAVLVGTEPAALSDILRDGLLDGFRLALTSALPLEASPAVLLWIFTLVWWASYWAAKSAVTRPALPLVLLPPGLVFLTGVAFGVAAPGERPPVAALFVVLALLLRGVRAGTGARGMPVLAVLAVTVAVGSLSIGERLPYQEGGAAADPRTLVRPPLRQQRQPSPLALANRWLAEPPRRVLEVTTTAPVAQRLMVLDRYDGIDWSSDASYSAVGARLPGRFAGPGRAVRQRVTVHHLPLTWLPAVGRPVTVTGAPVRADLETGVLTTADGRPATGAGYSVESRVPVLSAARAARATPGHGAEYEGLLDVPPMVPPSLLREAERLAAGERVPYRRLLALRDHLRAHYRYDIHAAPGRTAGHLRYFFDQKHRGTADQFATAFALMARHLGFPARVAVGFAPGRALGPAGAGQAGRYEITTGDVAVWPEVALEGLGWVPFSVLPRPSGGGGAATGATPVGEPPDRASVDRELAAMPPTSPAMPAEAAPGHAQGNRHAAVWWAVGAAAVLLLGYLLPGPCTRRWIRWRRRAGTPRQRVAGAWQEAVAQVARLPDAGGRLTAPAEEIAERAGALLGPEAAAGLAGLARRLSVAVFSPHPVGGSDAEAAWSSADRVRTAVNRRLGRRGRMRELTRPPWRTLRVATRRTSARTGRAERNDTVWTSGLPRTRPAPRAAPSPSSKRTISI